MLACSGGDGLRLKVKAQGKPHGMSKKTCSCY